MAVNVNTAGGAVTSYHEVWKDKQGRSVWAWRCDEGEPPFDFGSLEAAEQWIDEVWRSATSKRDREDRATWSVVLAG